MRVANKTIFENMKLRLGQLTSDLQKANEIVSTGNRINNISDDPVGLTQVLTINSNLDNLDQFKKNINTGQTWIDGQETALSTINDQILQAKQLALQLSNSSVGPVERKNAAENIQNILKEIVSLSNTQINDEYIFAGTKTDTLPFAMDDENRPTQISYNGNQDPFSVKITETSTIAAGRNGEDVFNDKTIKVDETNNKIDFIEFAQGYLYPSAEITAEVKSGTYTRQGLATAIQTAMNIASSQDGYDLNYSVSYDTSTQKYSINDDGAVPQAHVELLFGTGTHAGHETESLTSDLAVKTFNINDLNDKIVFRQDTGAGWSGPLEVHLSHEGYATGDDLASEVQKQMNNVSGGTNFQVTYNDVTNQFTIQKHGGSTLQKIQILWGSEPNDNTAASALGFTEDDLYPSPYQSEHVGGTTIASDIGFDAVDVRDAVVSDQPIITPITIGAGNNTIDFIEDFGMGAIPRTATIVPSLPAYNSVADLNQLATDIETALDAAGTPDYKVTYDEIYNKFVIEKEGTTTLNNVQFLWNTNPSGNSAGTSLGFTSDVTYSAPTSQNKVEWNIFRSLIDLRDDLDVNDVDGVFQSITRLQSHFENIEQVISDTGHKATRLEVRNQIISDLNLSLSERKSNIKEADYIEAVMDLKSKEFVYNAALNSSARILQVSLVDFM